MTEDEQQPLVDFDATARRIRQSVLVIGSAVVVLWLVVGLVTGGPTLGLAGWVLGGLVVMFLVEVWVVGGSPSWDAPGGAGRTPGGDDVAIIPPQLRRRTRPAATSGRRGGRVIAESRTSAPGGRRGWPTPACTWSRTPVVIAATSRSSSAPARAGSADLLQLRDKTATEDIPSGRRGVPPGVRRGRCTVRAERPAGSGRGRRRRGPRRAGGRASRPRRRVVGPDVLIGRSTHGPDQLDAAADVDVDYVAVGPARHPDEGRSSGDRAGAGRHAARYACVPWFAIGGIDPSTIGDVLDAGARRIVVVRAVTQADDPEAAAGPSRRPRRHGSSRSPHASILWFWTRPAPPRRRR